MKTLEERIDTEEDGYSVDRFGNIYSKNYNHTGQEKQMTPYPTGNGYLQVRMNGKPCLAHRVVAIAFIPNPDSLPCVNHKDENKQNNAADNLEWCTRQYNHEYSNAKNYEVLTPDGFLLDVFNLGKFCREWNLNAGNMNSVAKGNMRQYRGFQAWLIEEDNNG